ncbi:MAG: hypothetical protein AAGB15_00620 [Pseudomonadota bacterium]
MRAVFALPLAAAVALAGCDQRPGGSDRIGRGAPVQLAYAEPDTRINLVSAANGQTSETTITVLPTTGLRGAYRGADGSQGSFYPGCWGCGTGMTIEEEKYASLWPLEIGKQAVFLRTAPDGQQARMQIRVSSFETVSTPAGEFEAYALDGRIEHITGPRYSAQVRAWWAPGPGWVVKAEGGDSRGNTLSSQVAEIARP